MTWVCEDCGHEEESRCLMCPECTTDEDWAWAKAALKAAREGLAEMKGWSA